MNEMATNNLARQEALNLFKEKERQARLALDTASEASQDLLEATNKALSEEIPGESSLPGSSHELLSFLAEFLTKEAEAETLALSEIQDESKDPEDQKDFSKDEFNTHAGQDHLC